MPLTEPDEFWVRRERLRGIESDQRQQLEREMNEVREALRKEVAALPQERNIFQALDTGAFSAASSFVLHGARAWMCNHPDASLRHAVEATLLVLLRVSENYVVATYRLSQLEQTHH